MRAGTARQLVPGEGELLIDLRAPSTAEADALARTVAAHVAGLAVAEGVALEVSGGTTRPAWERSEATATLFAAARSAAAALGVPTFEVAERGGSDASFAGALGVPTLDGLGPPCVGSCSRAESVLVDDLAAWGAILCAVAASVGEGSHS